MSYGYSMVTATSTSGPVTITLPNTFTTSTSCQIKIINTDESEKNPMSNAKTVAHKVVFTDGTTETFASDSHRACDGLITLIKGRVEAVVLNQDLVRSYVPVQEDEAPELTVGAYTFEVHGSKTKTVRADRFHVVNKNDKDAGQFQFLTDLPSGVARTELTVPVAAVTEIVRVEAPADAS